MPESQIATSNEEPQIMTRRRAMLRKLSLVSIGLVLFLIASGAIPAAAQRSTPRDPAEPAQAKPRPKPLARPAGGVARQAVDEQSMRALIGKLVTCGTRLTLSSWTDSKRGIGCGRDVIVARFNEIAKDSGGKLQVVVDKFESTSERTSGKPMPLENVYAILPGSDPKLAKTIFIVSGHFDSRPSNVMDPEADAPGADDDASGVAASVECARLLSKAGANGGGTDRATVLFAAGFRGEERMLCGTQRFGWGGHGGRRTESNTGILRNFLTLRLWGAWRGAMRKGLGSWQWVRVRRRGRSFRVRSRRTPKCPGRPKMIPNGRDLKFCGERLLIRDGRSVTS